MPIHKGETWRAGGSRVSRVVRSQGDQQWGTVMSCHLCSSLQGLMHKALQMQRMRMISTKAVAAHIHKSYLITTAVAQQKLWRCISRSPMESAGAVARKCMRI